MSARTNTAIHLETEMGYPISEAEHLSLLRKLPKRGFAFQKKSRITDFVVPTVGTTTKRVRIERIKESTDGSHGLHCYFCQKSHPIKGANGRDVRRESEKKVSHQTALSLIVRELEKLNAPIPYYTKKRWHFQGSHKGLTMTIALDHATGLGKFSGTYMEIETILPINSKDVSKALESIEKLSKQLLGEKRRTKISYRKMLLRTWTHCRKSTKRLAKTKTSYRRLVKKIADKGVKQPPPTSKKTSARRTVSKRAARLYRR